MNSAETWIQTFTGQKFYPLYPDPDTVKIEDIAHALSQTIRFSGHCDPMYSVAQHSVLISENVSEENAFWGLMHDAAEAYLTDVPKPIKAALDNYEFLEDHLLKTIVTKYGLSWPMPDEVHNIDKRLLTTEIQVLLPECERYRGLREPLDIEIEAITPAKAKKLFLDRFTELYGSTDD